MPESIRFFNFNIINQQFYLFLYRNGKTWEKLKLCFSKQKAVCATNAKRNIFSCTCNWAIIFLIAITNNRCCSFDATNITRYRIDNKSALRICGLKRISIKNLRKRFVRNAAVIVPIKCYRKRLLIEAQNVHITRSNDDAKRIQSVFKLLYGPAATIPYNPLKLVSFGQNLYYYSHYSGPRTCLMGRFAIAQGLRTNKSRDT